MELEGGPWCLHIHEDSGRGVLVTNLDEQDFCSIPVEEVLTKELWKRSDTAELVMTERRDGEDLQYDYNELCARHREGEVTLTVGPTIATVKFVASCFQRERACRTRCLVSTLLATTTLATIVSVATTIMTYLPRHHYQ